MHGLQGKHIAIAGARKGEEISKLIENFGGIPYVRPAQGTVFLDERRVGPDLERLLAEGTDWMILTTGVGTETLIDMAERLGRKDALLDLLRRANIASRGYKTRNVLKQLGIEPVAQDDDGTIRGLVRSLSRYEFRNARVALQLYGDMPAALMQWLEQAGAKPFEILPYRHIPPADGALQRLIRELKGGKFDAVLFTSAVQVQYLFAEADVSGDGETLRRTFHERTLAVAVGIVTAEALEDAGVSRLIQPENQRMGGMVVELNRYFASDRHE